MGPASADAGKIFDFNATLPAMAAQFLLLMGFLDKTWFGPVGEVIDEREEKIRDSWNNMKNSNNELETRQKEAEKMLQETRDKAKAEMTEEKESRLRAEKSKLDGELARAVSTIESEKLTIQAELDSQVPELSQQIIKNVLPDGFSL